MAVSNRNYNEYNIRLRYSWDLVAQTVWNPIIKKPKCISSDVISRKMIGKNKLHTRRILQQQLNIANPLAKLLTNGLVYVVEESIIDRETRTVEMYTYNIPRNSLYEIVEKSVFRASPLNSKWTTCIKRAWMNNSLPRCIQNLMVSLMFDEYSKNATETDQELGQLLLTASDTMPRQKYKQQSD